MHIDAYGTGRIQAFVTFRQNKITLVKMKMKHEYGSVFLSCIYKSLSGHLQSVAVIVVSTVIILIER